MNKVSILVIILLVAVTLAIVGCQATRAGYESAPYKVVRSTNHFQVRDYPQLMVAETPMAGPGQEADGSFGRLFGFITGRNDSKQKIAMTTPVLMSGSDSKRTMAFVVPAKLKPEEVPKPADGAVSLRNLPAGRFAVLRYSGGRNPEKEAETLGQLKSWMASEGMNVLSGPVYGYFDPPWTPAFLRRNEVMLRIDAVK